MLGGYFTHIWKQYQCNMENNKTDQTGQHARTNDLQPVAEMTRLQSHLIRKLSATARTEVDAIRAGADYKFAYSDITSTAVSIVLRCVAVFVNIRLAYDFYVKGETHYFAWTTACIVVPLVVTSAIHCFMCYEDGKFDNGLVQASMTCLLILASSICLRYLYSLIYAVRCKCAELRGDKESQIMYFKRAILEESDVAFIRLFECFLESAPQKILQISIVLRQDDKISYLQAIVIAMHFASMAWCLASYQRYVRYAQEDKYNINFQGLVCHLCWHFCVSVSRTLCISFVASIFPLWTLLLCLLHAVLFGIIIFIADRPRCPKHLLPNLIFCFLFGIVYLFTYLTTRDEPTRQKYLAYYSFCSIENICCIVLFVFYTSSGLKSSIYLFNLLWSMPIAFYCIGISIMIVYYAQFHPQITARKSKRLMTSINNN